MTADHDQPPDTQRLSDLDLHVYETIATLEYLNRPVTQAEIAAAAQLSETSVGQTLESLTQGGLLVRSEYDGEPVFEPARRDWGAAPGQSSGLWRL